MKKDRKNPLVKSFGYAFEGIWACIRKERNMKIHCLAVILVTLTGTLLQISASEWCVCLLLFALVASLELVNTAVEAVVDLVTEEKKPLAKLAKGYCAYIYSLFCDCISDHRMYHFPAISIGTGREVVIQ